MEIINTYDETINYYMSKIIYALDEFDDASRELREIKNNSEIYWSSQAGAAYADKAVEIDGDFVHSKEGATNALGNLRALKSIIEEEIRKLIEEAKAAEEAAAAMAESIVISEIVE